MKKFIIFLLIINLVVLTSCSKKYAYSELQELANKELLEPFKIHLKILQVSIGHLKVNKVKDIKPDIVNQRIIFDFDIDFYGEKTGKKKFKSCILSAEPHLHDGKISLINIKAEKIDLYDFIDIIPMVNQTDITNYFINDFFTEYNIVKLTGLNKLIVKEIKIDEENVKLKLLN